MAPIDWEDFMAINTDELGDRVDELVELLSEFDAGSEDDTGRLRKLFAVSQGLVFEQTAKVDVLQDELDEMVQKDGKDEAQKDQNMEDLRREVASLRQENKDMQRFGADGGLTGGRDVRMLREEIQELELQIGNMEREKRDVEKQLKDERADNERLAKRAEDAERDYKDMKKENESLRDDVADYKRQNDALRQSMMSRKDDDVDFRDKMSKKNKLMNAALEENRLLAEENDILQKKIDELKKELKEGREEIVKTTNDYLSLKGVVKGNDDKFDGLRRDNEMLREQVFDLQERVKSKGDADDEIMVQVDRKVDEWKGLLIQKGDVIADLQMENMKLKDQLIAANIDTEKSSVSALTKAVEDRDRKIEALRTRLNEAVFDMESNVALMEDVRNIMQKGGGTKDMSDKQVKKLSGMMNTMRIQEDHLKEADARALEAEADARDKDKQLSEALERMRQYEAGEYGLAEAVAEIKDCKSQITIRDRQVEDLTQYINRVELKVNDLFDENESLRERLGLDPAAPIDLSQYRKNKDSKVAEERMNSEALQMEVERQQEIIIQLQLELRKIRQSTGQPPGPLETQIEQMLAEAYENRSSLPLKPGEVPSTKGARAVNQGSFASLGNIGNVGSFGNFGYMPAAHGEMQDQLVSHGTVQKIQVERDNELHKAKLDNFRKDNAELKLKIKEVEEQNEHLETSIKEVHQALSEQGDEGEMKIIKCPSLDRMLAAIEAKSTLQGRYDTSLYLKAQVDNLTGHNEELRNELKDARYESTRCTVELDRYKVKVSAMEEEIKELREVGAGGHFQAMPLPEGMAVTSSDVIANINEHLVQTLQELHLKEEMLMKMETSLENYKRKFAVMRHQQGLVYGDYIKEKKAWEEDQTKIEEAMKNMESQKDEDNVRIQEFDRLVDTLSQDEVEVRRRLSDMTRKITVLRVNEKALSRRYNAMAELEGTLRKDNSKLKNEIIQMEVAVSERLGYLQRFKDMSAFKIAALQKALDDSVPRSDLDRANLQYTELTEKYRSMLDKTNHLVMKSEVSAGYETEIKRLNSENSQLKTELGLDKEKLHTLEGAFENMRKQGMLSSRDLTDSDVTSLSKRLTMLEMKELNERQRAEHAVRMYDAQKQQLRQLEDRNFELEEKFSEITKLNIEAQKTERELRDELSNCVSKEVSDADRKRITELEKNEMSAKLEISKLKEISDISTSQSRALEAQQVSRDKEVLSLRQQLLDFQSQSDEKTVIGKLHRHIVQLQVSEGTAVRKLEDANKKIYKIQAQHLRAEQDCDNKDQAIYHNRLDARSKAKYLKNTVQDLRRKFAGSVPLPRQEKFAQAMVKLVEDKTKMEEELKKTNDERLSVEDKLAELNLRHSGLQELIDTIQDGKGAQKVADWHSRMEGLRLEELRHKRQIERSKHQVQFLEQLLKKHEAEVLNLEEDKVRLAKDFEERELEWEQREVELERIIHNMERMQAEIAGAANRFEEAVSSLPDPNWPVSRQLEHAITTIKSNVKLIMDAKGEAEVYKKKMTEMQDQIRELEREVTQRDRVLTELRLRLPATADRDNIIAQATATASATPRHEDYESKQAVRVAQSTVQSLQARISQKEETLKKYQELLTAAREDMQRQNRQHEEEVKALQGKLHSKSDAEFVKFKENIIDSVSRPSAPIATNEQLKRLNEMEDTVAEQDNAIAALREKLAKSREEGQDLKYQYEDEVRAHHEDKEGLLEEHSAAIADLQRELDEVRKDLDERDRDLEVTQAELQTAKEANARAPTTTMKGMVERLKNQLSLKEKQHKALSKALMELRADMVTNAQDDVKANMDKTAIEYNVQKLVDKATKDFQDQVEELTAQRDKSRKDVKKYREKESGVNSELEEVRHDVAKKEGQMRKLKDDRSRLEGEVEELERKVERMSTMARQKGAGAGGPEGMVQEVEELRRKNRLLQEEVRRAKHQAEKPYEQQPPPPPPPAKDDVPEKTNRDEAVLRWDESKKWQKMNDRLKGRVKDKEQEIEKLSRANELLKNGLERANRDKESLEGKLRGAQKFQVADMEKQAAPSTGQSKPRAGATHDIEPIRRKNYELEEELGRLKREMMMSRDAAFQEVQLRNKFLTEKLEQLEKEMGRRVTASQDMSGGGGMVSRQAYKEMSDKEHTLQKQVLKLSEENIELKFEVEQARTDIPRLKERIEDLQKYVEVLKTEKSDLQQLNSARSLGSMSLNSLGSSGSNIRRIGESGKSQKELEKTVALLKKVVERTQAEKEALKRAPGVVSNEQMRGLQMENQSLKSQLEDLRQKMGSTLSERYTSQQKGTSKVMADHDKLRRDVMKEMESNEKLRLKNTQQALKMDQLQKELADYRDRLHTAETQGPNTSGSMDNKGWQKSTVLTRMYEGKLKTLEAELDNKNSTLADVKVLLREAAERENKLIRKTKEMEKKIAVLERFPPGSNVNDTDVMRDYQLARLTIDRLENEKKELLHEIRVMRQALNPEGGGPGDIGEDELLERLKSHDELVEENVDVRTQLKTAELDNQKFRLEVVRLKKELENFGPDFFEEIEDLKYNYRKAVEKNVLFEEQLRTFSHQFGVSVNIPDN